MKTTVSVALGLVISFVFGFSLPALAASANCGATLSIAVTAGNPSGVGFVDYQLTAHNPGTVACQSSAVSAYYASGEKFVASSPALTKSNYYWSFGTLAPGATRTISLTTYRSSTLAAGVATMEACLSASNGADSCANAVAVAAAPVVSPTNAAPTSTTSAPASQEYGIWQWTPLSQLSVAQMQTIVNNAAANHFTAIYQTVDEYLTIDAMPNGAAKNQALATYDASVNEFLTLAAAKGIAVDAEAGWRDWAEPGNTWQAYDIMNFVASYNQGRAPKFRGVQFDIEPYLLPQYAASMASEGAVLTQYAQLAEGLVGVAQADGLPLGFDLPIFYTASAGATPEITVDGVTAYPYNQVLRLLGELPAGHGRILLMDYRNSAAGLNGAIDLADEEVHDADGTGVKVIIGQETGPVTPSYVTFYGMTKNALTMQTSLVGQAFVGDGSYDGIAIDYYDYYIELE